MYRLTINLTKVDAISVPMGNKQPKKLKLFNTVSFRNLKSMKEVNVKIAQCRDDLRFIGDHYSNAEIALDKKGQERIQISFEK
jgi:hypothetical protein